MVQSGGMLAVVLAVTIVAAAGVNGRTSHDVVVSASSASDTTWVFRHPSSFTGWPVHNCGSPSDSWNWSYAQRAYGNTTWATAGPSKGQNTCTEWGGFGFSIPSNVTVTGVKVLLTYNISKVAVPPYRLNVGVYSSNGPMAPKVRTDTSQPLTPTVLTFDFTNATPWVPASFNGNAIRVDVGAVSNATGGLPRFGMKGLIVLVGYTSIVTPPPPAPPPSDQGFNFTVAGDYNWTFDTSGRVMWRAANLTPAFHLALGDLNATPVLGPDKEKDWCAMMKSYVNNTEVVAGNHDAWANNYDNISRIVPSCPFTLGSYAGNYGREYYFDYPASHPLARFVLTSCGMVFSVDAIKERWPCQNKTTDAHYMFVKNALDGAHALGIPWTIVGLHYPFADAGDSTPQVGPDFVNLVMYERVSLVLHGHIHHYERTSQLTCFPQRAVNYTASCIAVRSSPYLKGAGTVDVIVGTGGQVYSEDLRRCPLLYWQTCTGGLFAVLSVRITATSLTASYDWVSLMPGRRSPGPLSDTFTITS